MTIHRIVFITAIAWGLVEIGAWLHTWWHTRQELKQRGWVCLDLPSPDTILGPSTQYRQRTFIARILSAVPALGSIVILTVIAFCMRIILSV